MDLQSYQEAQQRHFKRNALSLFFDTALTSSVLKLLSPTVTLAFFVGLLTQSQVAVGMISAIYMVGGMMSQILWASLMARYRRKKWAWVLGTVVSRGAMLFFLASALLARGDSPTWPLIVFYVGLTIHAFSNGLVNPLWQNFIAKVFPKNRGRFLGIAYFVEALLSLGAASIMRSLLDTFPGPQGFVYYFAILCAYGLLSALPAFFFKEVPYPVVEKPLPFKETIKQMPRLLRDYPSYARYVACRVLVCFAEMAAAYYTFYAANQLGATGTHVAIYTMLITIGGLLANLLWGALGDRIGFIRVFQITFGIGAVMLVMVLSAQSPTALYPVFFLQGVYAQGITLSVTNLNMATSPPEQTPLFVATANAITGPFLAFLPLVASGIIGAFGFRTLFVFCLVIYIVDIVLASWAAKAPAERLPSDAVALSDSTNA